MPDSLSKSQLNFSSVYSMHAGAAKQGQHLSMWEGAGLASLAFP